MFFYGPWCVLETLMRHLERCTRVSVETFQRCFPEITSRFNEFMLGLGNHSISINIAKDSEPKSMEIAFNIIKNDKKIIKLGAKLSFCQV